MSPGQVGPTLALIEGKAEPKPGDDPCIFSLLHEQALRSDAAYGRELGKGGTTRDQAFVTSMVEQVGKRAGFVSSQCKVWDAQERSWTALTGVDKARFKGSDFAIRHFGAVVPYTAEGFCDKNFDRLDAVSARRTSSPASLHLT